ncbi:MAG: hypothetical protein AB7N71_09895 [Phycisphaerae bacterium]
MRSMTLPTVPTVMIAIFFSGAHLLVAPAAAEAWRLIKPTNSGIPGEAVRSARFAPDGKLWVSARWPFYGEGGVGIYDLQNETWETYADWDSPIPSQYVNEIQFAADGSVWMACGLGSGPGGLVHKVGDQWTVYDASNSPLHHNIVRTIEFDSEGHVWLINYGSQEQQSSLFEFDGVNWREFTVPDDIPFAAPWDGLASLKITRDDHVFVTNIAVPGMAEFDGETWQLHESLERLGGMYEDSRGVLWIIGGLGSVNYYQFDRTTETFSIVDTPLDGSSPGTIFRDRDTRIYLTNSSGQVIRTSDFGETWSSFTFEGLRVSSIAQQDNGDFWVTTPGAVRHLDENGTWIEAFNTYNTGIPDDTFEQLYRAPDGNMWFVTAEAGISEYADGRYHNRGSHNPNEPWPVLADGADSMFVDRADNVWFGTNGVGRIDPAGQLTLWDWRNTSSFGVMNGQAVGEDLNGDIWVGSQYGGIYRFSDATWDLLPLGDGGFSGSDVQAIAHDSAGNMWVAAPAAIHCFDGVTWTSWNIYDDPSFPYIGFIRSMGISPDDTVWIGLRAGFARFDGDGFTAFTQANSPLPGESVEGIAFRESDGLMAVSSHTFQASTPFPHGLILIDGAAEDPNNWTIYDTTNSPMRHYQLGHVAFDGDGNLWLETQTEGVAVLLIGDNGLPGDLNCDGLISVSDVGPFVMALTDPAGYSAVFPDCDITNGDLNDDGVVSVGDIGEFVALLTTN